MVGVTQSRRKAWTRCGGRTCPLRLFGGFPRALEMAPSRRWDFPFCRFVGRYAGPLAPPSSPEPHPASTVKRFLILPLALAAVPLFAQCSRNLPEEQGTPDVAKTPTKPIYDGAQAWKDLETMVGIGARPAGSPGMAKQIEYITGELKKVGLEAKVEKFVSEVPVTTFTPEGKLNFENVYADLEGTQGKDSPMVILATHMDTKFLHDFVGANDAGSSTAVVLELARALAKAAPRPVTYRFLFLDGEEAVREFWEDPDNTYGSRHHAYQLFKTKNSQRLKAFVLLDMVGDKDLQLTHESNSTKWLMELFEEEAKKGGFEKHVGGPAQAIRDDHLPFLEQGVPSVDLIDFVYGPSNSYWHTSNDVMKNCSPESIEISGQIALLGLLRLEKHLTK